MFRFFYFERNKSHPQSFDITSSSSRFNAHSKYISHFFIFRLFHHPPSYHHKQLTNQLPELFIFPGNTNDFIIRVQDWRTPRWKISADINHRYKHPIKIIIKSNSIQQRTINISRIYRIVSYNASSQRERERFVISSLTNSPCSRVCVSMDLYRVVKNPGEKKGKKKERKKGRRMDETNTQARCNDINMLGWFIPPIDPSLGMDEPRTV